MLAYFHAALLGVVEGVTEFLPISSTAHLILASSVLRIAQTDLQKSFEIIIQLGAIFAVVAVYWRRFFDWQLLKRLVVAFVPTGIIGLALYRIIKAYLLGNLTIVIWSLFLGGLFLYTFELFHRVSEPETDASTQELSRLPYRSCLIIGLCQSVAVIPGVSRSAATIVGGLLFGMPRKKIVEFSFLLAVPTMFAATGLDVLKNYQLFSAGDFGLLAIGFIVSFVVALASIRWLLTYIKKHDFKAFGIYRMLVAFVFLAFPL
ncbi:undecaprenyl-diphosphatase UppP [Candidatus Uhrbacteria bacterium CG10_big_fil_rev_8_21_14_0_10_48_11]|uniref:Undecaprenyl-diphosphatase n=1 Tax=Candidatus Uhrbacteria bacterium CG10_big_fil_rev_8_21_14_0_10_48_11 TaxID=1975037 RepID=A0A2M8LF98_9BACT|nr:MAG: undecaprenyl-diphosphatase UppP [Candidatus Uhrbacteria bacterium CG10_big_fil_rev_8_21_14_0_10_48_11]